MAGAYFSWIFGNAKRAFLEAHSPTMLSLRTNSMSDSSRKIPFDEYYEMLLEFVETPEARDRLSEWNAATGRYYDKGGESSSPYEDDDDVYNALRLFEHVGFLVLKRHGWGDRRDMTSDKHSQAVGFCGLGEMLLRGRMPDWAGGTPAPSVRDKEKVSAFVKQFIERARLNRAAFPIDFGDRQ
ncbi:hypothetical protein [Bradyrhizobium genomosp. III]|uniref:hypothetical protein n=1 Tax=Bradyrhizobium genomosp. III TaxID=2683271 RepID=UPI0005773288|nr:hypothetical protein [Bradyrhizobium sp. CCBAU 15635]